jgi:hypothetical protein
VQGFGGKARRKDTTQMAEAYMGGWNEMDLRSWLGRGSGVVQLA